jgi:hypothetical protein
VRRRKIQEIEREREEQIEREEGKGKERKLIRHKNENKRRPIERK